jgi:hypothetical protein
MAILTGQASLHSTSPPTSSESVLVDDLMGAGAILITETTSPGLLIYTARNTGLDEIWLWGFGRDTIIGAKNITVEFGGTSSTDSFSCYIGSFKKYGAVLIVPGLILSAEAELRVYATDLTGYTVFGHVNKWDE